MFILEVLFWICVPPAIAGVLLFIHKELKGVKRPPTHEEQDLINRVTATRNDGGVYREGEDEL